MGGQKFQYDESGGTFFYFILSFLALILIPSTFYLWPRKKKEGMLIEPLAIQLYIHHVITPSLPSLTSI